MISGLTHNNPTQEEAMPQKSTKDAQQLDTARQLAERIKTTLPATKSIRTRMLTQPYFRGWDDLAFAIYGGEHFLDRYNTLINESNKDKWLGQAHARVGECLESAESHLIQIYRACRHAQRRRHTTRSHPRCHLVLLQGGRSQDGAH